jgi:diguanylate cyclase (GGDEF)-like protein
MASEGDSAGGLNGPDHRVPTLDVRYTSAHGLPLFVGMTGFALVSGIVLPAKRHDAAELGIAAALAVVLLIVMAVGARNERSGLFPRLMPFVFFVVIGLLRDSGGGSASGFEPLVLFPVLWLAQYERGSQWWVAATVCAGLTTVLPLIVVGAPRYESGDWRRSLFLVVFAGILGMTVRRWRHAQDVATTDRLTGVPNRRMWDEQLPRLTGLAKREAKPLSVAMVDIDWFKRFNDTFGHQAGDRLLANAARSWKRVLREGDLLARYGGEEFSIALYDCPAVEAREVLDRLRELTPEGQTCSAGIATLRKDEDWQELVARADAALYEAKRERNQTVSSPR